MPVPKHRPIPPASPTTRGILQRAAVDFAERRRAGGPGDVAALERAARMFVAEHGPDEAHTPSRSGRAVPVVDLAVSAHLDDWNAAGAELRELDPARFIVLLDVARNVIRAYRNEPPVELIDDDEIPPLRTRKAGAA